MENLEKVLNKIEDNWNHEVEFLQKLGSYPSTLGNERDVQEFLAEKFRDLELETDIFDPNVNEISSHPGYAPVEWSYEGRPAVVGTWGNKGPKVGKSLILQGHIDVVSPEPVHLWDYEPWGSTIVDNKMYGRGIADMKSGVTAMIYAVQAIKDCGLELSADVILQTVPEEECTGNGAVATLSKGYRADGVLIPEPFGLKAMTAQVGVIWVRVRVSGSGAHSIDAYESLNPIDKAYVLIDALNKYREHVNSAPKHPAFENMDQPLAVYVGTLHSGDWPSTVPSECTFEARIGLYPGQDPKDVQEEVKEWLLQAASQDQWLKEETPEITFIGFRANGVVLDQDSELFNVLESSHQQVFGNELEYCAIACTTDVRVYNVFHDIPATCFGPIGGNLHAPNEWVDLQSVKDCTKAYAAFILNWCGVRI